jgi:carbonic anhydrase
VLNYQGCVEKLDKKVAASDALFKGLKVLNKSWDEKIDWAAVMKGINMEYFYQYSGSITKPPCVEGVEWNVYSKVLYTRAKYINGLKKQFTTNENFAFGQGNNRRTQKMNDRQLYFNSAAGGSFSGAVATYASVAALSVATAALAF